MAGDRVQDFQELGIPLWRSPLQGLWPFVIYSAGSFRRPLALAPALKTRSKLDTGAVNSFRARDYDYIFSSKEQPLTLLNTNAHLTPAGHAAKCPNTLNSLLRLLRFSSWGPQDGPHFLHPLTPCSTRCAIIWPTESRLES